ncbi:MAG: flagellar protein export ATPase FliI [Fusobacteriia bacterium 4572_132]|nr:MAG: flagellar protein export ATPase FliI [Fusobacteriia bacterium 4572_132]
MGLTIESEGPIVKLGEHCYIKMLHTDKQIDAEVVGFSSDRILLMPLGEMTGIGHGCEVIATGKTLSIPASDRLLGRVLDGLGRPIDSKGKILADKYMALSNMPPNPLKRMRIKDTISVGVRAIDGELTCGKGQRVGIFAGSGVGKSTLLGMMARNSSADINVIGLIGERGREVREFLEKDLGEEGLKKSVVIVATSDQPALVRIKGALTATAVAEYFRDKGQNVLLMMDSLTRFAMAQREVGLAIGEPPATRGYTPSVFALLPKLLERTGNSDKGTITGLYTVLVDADDMNDPIADAVRGILDGHIILSRDMASKNHFPAIDILSSVSRVMSEIVTEEHLKNANKIREVLANYKEVEDLINIGAYKEGNNAKADYAIQKIEQVNNFLKQGVKEKSEMKKTIDEMKELFL